ncbi:MAG: SLBB domain-containing protein [Ignavibacteriae bacterium]|nr:SLBB domain-containing protein [Ignavibacteriota bacterium]
MIQSTQISKRADRVYMKINDQLESMRYWMLSTSVLTILLFSSIFLPLQAQPKENPVAGTDIKTIFGEEEGTSRFPTSSMPELNPVERRINPDYYYVGPNDYLMISTDLTAFPIVVGVDNKLVLPRGITPINVDGMTLADLEDTLQVIFRQRSSGFGNVQVSLQAPRAIYINVGGEVNAPGRYVVTSADRVSTAIDLANRIPEELASADKQALELSKQTLLGNGSQRTVGNVGIGQAGGSLRKVQIRHVDGTTDEADLIRYQAFGDDINNPTLREGDQIMVEVSNKFNPTISIAGAVNNPIVGLRYRPGDNVQLLLNLSAGLHDDALPKEAYVVRSDGSGSENIPIDLSDNNNVKSFTLKPGDQIIVPNDVRSKAANVGVVTVQGEVVFPQTFPIIPGETRLSQVIERAGGFTPFASLNGSYIRRPADPLDLRPKQLVGDPPIVHMATSSLNLEDTLRYGADLQLQQNLVSADFVAIFREKDASKDVILQSGDEISIPREKGQVYISGRIRHPGWVTYAPGEKYDYYIAQAGGYTAAAAPNRVQIEKFGTGVWDGIQADVESGDHIYVPGERDTPARSTLEQAATILSIAGSILFIANTIVDIVNKISSAN